MSVCKLCHRESPLRLSHIIPRFAVKWLKETSATGYLRGLRSRKRLQETERDYLLCADCEQLLAKDEKRFSEDIFIPYHEGLRKVFDHDVWLKRFLVGLHWRVLVKSTRKHDNDIQAAFDVAAENWRQFLLGERNDDGGCEFHVFFADTIENSTGEVPAKFNWYMARGFDATPVTSSSGGALVYAKLVKIVTVSFVTPRSKTNEDWKGTLVSDRGTLRLPQQINTTHFGRFLEDRARLIEQAPATLSDRQLGKIKEQFEADPEKLLSSVSYKVHLADKKFRQQIAAKSVVKGKDRNKPCPCGSGIKAKKCCLSGR